MIFSSDYDRSLLMILVNDKKNRYEISKLINSLPVDLIINIRSGINSLTENEIIINKAIRSDDGATAMFRIKIQKNKLIINLSKWINTDEETYEFVLVPLLSSYCDNIDDTIYIGGFSSKYIRLSSFLGNTLIAKFNCMMYELYEDLGSNLIIQLSGDKIEEKVVNVNMISKDIDLCDISNRKKLNRLVKNRRMG